MIRYLEKDELGECRSLWQEAFPEDSREFADYYFNKKLLQSRVLVKEDESGRIVTMAHLNPYQVKAGAKTWNLDYIVGVATAANSRHQGHMRDVLERMLLDMHDGRKPFCYLMPASPDIYRPFGFRYIFNQPQWHMRRDAEDGLRREEIRLDGTRRDGMQPEQLAAWMNHWLASRYEVYALRNRSYMELLQAELDSEKGRVYGWYGPDGSLEALQAFWGMGKQEQRFLYCAGDEWLAPPEVSKPDRPAIMARITNVAAFAEVVRLNEECPCSAMEVRVCIHDSLIPGNSGLWIWKLDREGSALKRETVPGLMPGDTGKRERRETLVSTEVLELTIEQLAGWLFGYCALREALEAEAEELPFWCRYVEPLRGVFLDEVV